MSNIFHSDGMATFGMTTDTAGVEVYKKIIGESTVFLATLKQLQQIAVNEVPLLIEGETGSGNEAAQAIDYRGERSARLSVPVNYGVLPDLCTKPARHSPPPQRRWIERS